MEAYISVLSKVLILSLMLFCSSCYVTNQQTILKKKDGTDVILYENDNQKMFLIGYMKERNQVVGFKHTIPDSTDVVKLSLRINKFKTLTINKFTMSIWYENGNSYSKIDDGRIYFDTLLTSFRTYVDINDSIKNLTLEPMGIYSVNTIFITESEESSDLITPKKYLIETDIDFTLDGKNYAVQKTDTLYKKVIKKHRITVH